MDKSLRPLQRPPLLSHAVQEAIRAYILDNNLRPGDPLPAESELARQLGVSRNSVREAVKGLESLGVLEMRRGSGIYVRDFSFEPLLENLAYGLLSGVDELAELLEVRRVLETGMIQQAIVLVSTQQVDKLQSVLNHMRERAERGEAFPEEDRLFHQVLFANVNNRILQKLIDIFWLAFHNAVEHKALSSRDAAPMLTYRNHMAIAEAVQARDVATARSALEQHYTEIVERLTRAKRNLKTHKELS